MYASSLLSVHLKNTQPNIKCILKIVDWYLRSHNRGKLNDSTANEYLRLIRFLLRLSISESCNYEIFLLMFVSGMSPEDEWYSKSLTALRMNTSHHSNLAAPMIQYQT